MTSHNHILFLGTGTSVGIPMIGCTCEVCVSADPADKRLRTSAIIAINGINLLIDIGPDFRFQMLRSKIHNLSGILLTHDHRDHVAGLDDLRAFNFIHNKSYPIYCNEATLKGVREQFGFIFDNVSYNSKAQFDIHLISKDARFTVEDIEVQPIEVIHGKQAILGYRLLSLTYITDASHIEETELEKMKGTEILVLNALRLQPHPTHFSLHRALEIIEIIQPKQTYLTHISHHMGLHASISSTLPENVFLAYDGLSVPF